jgi:hypothetical protein
MAPLLGCMHSKKQACYVQPVVYYLLCPAEFCVFLYSVASLKLSIDTRYGFLDCVLSFRGTRSRFFMVREFDTIVGTTIVPAIRERKNLVRSEEETKNTTEAAAARPDDVRFDTSAMPPLHCTLIIILLR